MSRAATLINAGLGEHLARLIGVRIDTSLEGNGTTQGNATEIGHITCAEISASSSNTAFILPADVPIGHRAELYCVSSTTAVVFPESGGNIDNAGVDTSVSIAQNKGRMFRKTQSGVWKTVAGA